MHVREIKYLNPSSLDTKEAVINEIDRILTYLKETSLTLTPKDINDGTVSDWYCNQLDWVKRLYEQLERLLYDNLEQTG